MVTGNDAADRARPPALEVYSMVLLAYGGRYLLLRRAATKRFAPGRWTGLGGRVEPEELADLHAAALREVQEETGIAPEQIAGLTLRRVLVQARPGAPLTLLLYFTGTLAEPVLPASDEGDLAWVTADEIAGLDVIDNTAQVLPLLIDGLTRDPAGREPPRLGVASYHPDGTLERIVWG